MENKFSKRLSELRKEKNYTAANMGKHFGITHAAYLYWEQGKTEPKIQDILEICNIFDVSADYLIGLSNNDFHEWQAQPTKQIEQKNKIKITPTDTVTLHYAARTKDNINSEKSIATTESEKQNIKETLKKKPKADLNF